MMKSRSRMVTHKSAGFSLLELLLTLTLMALLLGGLYQLLDNWAQRAVNRTAATDMLRIANNAQNAVLTNFDTYKVRPEGVFYPLPDVEGTNAFRQRVRAFYRNTSVLRLKSDGTVFTDGLGNPQKIHTIEVLTLSDNPVGDVVRIANKRLMDTAQAGGPKMGIVSNVVLPGVTFAGRVSSMFNEWWVDRSAVAAAGYAATPDSRAGYLAVYARVNTEASDADTHWLYRIPIEGRPELNRMETDLKMNGNRLTNVGTVVADRIDVTGNAAFRGKAQGNNTQETAQAMTVEQALRVDGGGESRLNMRDLSGGCSFINNGANRLLSGNGCNIAGGEVQVIAENVINPLNGSVLATAGNATMSIGNLTSDGSVITDNTYVGNRMTSQGVSTFETVAGNSLSASSAIIAPSTTVTGLTVQTQQMQTINMGLAGGAVIQNQLVAAKIEPRNRNFTAPALDVGNAVQLNGPLLTSNATATNTLYMGKVEGNYRDIKLPQNVACTQYNGRTYCEPNGQTLWRGGQYLTNCSILADGYQCWHYRNPPFSQPYGYCRYTRGTGNLGQAYHTTNCMPL